MMDTCTPMAPSIPEMITWSEGWSLLGHATGRSGNMLGMRLPMPWEFIGTNARELLKSPIEKITRRITCITRMPCGAAVARSENPYGPFENMGTVYEGTIDSFYSQSKTVVATKTITLFFSGLLQFRQGKIVALGRLPILWMAVEAHQRALMTEFQSNHSN
jgi:hypothetical protein